MTLLLQTLDGESVIELIKKLVVLDSEWIPKEKGYSLYVRELRVFSLLSSIAADCDVGPTLIGTQNALGVAASNDALFFVICCPVRLLLASGDNAY